MSRTPAAIAVAASLVLLRAKPSQGQAPQARADGDLVSAIHALNDAEIESGNVAATAAKSPDVQASARTMAADHSASNAKIDRWLAADGGVSAAEGPIARTVRAGAARDKAQLAGKTGPDFEREYLAQQVQAHQAAIALLDSEGRNASQHVTGLLEDTRNMLADHLEQAKALQARLGAAAH